MAKQKLLDLIRKKQIKENETIRERYWARRKVGKNYSAGFEFKEPILDMRKAEQCMKRHDEELKKDGFDWGISKDEQGGPFSIWISKLNKETMGALHYTQILKEGNVILTLDAVGKKIFRELMESCLIEGTVGIKHETEVKVEVKPTETQPATTDAQVQKQKRIFIIDDEDATPNTIKMYNERRKWGYSLDIFDKPEAILEKIAKEGCDLVLTDKDMPHMKGPELADKVNEINPNIPVILMTGDSCIEKEKVMAEHKSLAGIVLKPFDMDELKNMIKRLIG